MSTSYPPVYSIRYEVTIGGTTYSEADGQIANLKVTTSLTKADKFTVTFNKPFDPEQSTFPDVDWDSLSAKTPVTVSMGWGGDGSLTELFDGKITKVDTKFSKGNGPTVTVTAMGPIHEMKKTTNDRTWGTSKNDKKVKLEKVVNTVLDEGSYFDNKDVKASLKKRALHQNGQSDYKFINKLVNEYTYRFYTSAGTVYFKPKSSVGGGSPVATLEYGAKLSSFSGSIDDATTIGKVKVKYWDEKKEKDVQVTEGDGKPKRTFRVPCDSKSEAKDIAKNKHSKLCKARAKGNGTTRGNPKLVAGEVVKLTGMGKRFSQNYYITQATHSIGSSGYTTDFKAKEVPE